MDSKSRKDFYVVLLNLIRRYSNGDRFLPEDFDMIVKYNGDIPNIDKLYSYIQQVTDEDPFVYLERQGLYRDSVVNGPMQQKTAKAAVSDHKPVVEKQKKTIMEPVKQEAQEKSVEELAREMAEKMYADMLKKNATTTVVSDNSAHDVSHTEDGRIKITNPSLQRKMNSLLGKLEKWYPEHKVFALDAIDKDARKYLSELYPLIGYETDSDLLEAYGYEFIEGEEVRALRNYTTYAPGEEPEVIKGKVDSMLSRLEEYYPDHIIRSSLQYSHKSLGKDAAGLYQWLGYDSMQSMLEAYGFEYQAKAGRRAKDHDAIVQELIDKYKDKPKPGSLGELIFDNPEYKSELKTISNSAQEWYGMTAAKYFKQIGIIQDKQKEAKSKKEKSNIAEAAAVLLEGIYNNIDYEKYGDYDTAVSKLDGLIVKKKVAGIVISDCKTDKEEIDIPFGIELIDQNAFSNNNTLRAIHIPESVRSIRKSAFSGCERLENITIDEGLSEVEELAFRNCISLRKIVLPESLERIGDYAFAGCENLESIVLKNDMTLYGQSSFQGCKEQPAQVIEENETDASQFECTSNKKNEVTVVQYLGNDRNVVVPKRMAGGNVRTIGKAAFKDNTMVQEVILPDCVENVQGGAFSGCTSLKKVHLSERMTKIVRGTFTGCDHLEEVNIPDNMEELKENTFKEAPLKSLHIGKSLARLNARAFLECIYDPVNYHIKGWKNISHITIDPQNKNLVVNGSSIISSDGKIFWAMLGNEPNCIIPEGVEIIEERAFNMQIGLSDVSFPNTLREIRAKAFNQASLRSLEFPDGLKSIGDNAFERCEKLTSVIFNEGLESIGDYAFRDSPISLVMLPSTLTSLGIQSFSSLYMSYDPYHTRQKIQIHPDNKVFSSDDSVIYKNEDDGLTLLYAYSKDLKNRYYGYYNEDDEDDEDNDAGDMYDNDSSCLPVTYEVKNGTVRIGDGAFSRCENIKAVSFPASLRYIGSEAFYGCSVLSRVSLNSGLTSIGEKAFYDTVLNAIDIPASVTEIGSGALAVNSKADVTVQKGNSVFFIEDGTLYKKEKDGACSLVTHFGNQEISVVRSDTSLIMTGAYYHSIVHEISIPVTVQAIDDNAIKECGNLERFNIDYNRNGDKVKHAVMYIPGARSDERTQNNGFYSDIDYNEQYRMQQVRERYMDCLRITAANIAFDFAKYDSLFDSVNKETDQILIATDRLKSPIELIPAYEENYKRYLQNHAIAATKAVVEYDDVEGLTVLTNMDILTKKNIDSVIESANKLKKPEVLSYLLNFKNSKIGASPDDYEL